MKNTALLCCIAAAMVVAAGCGPSPKDVARKGMDAIKHRDYDAYCEAWMRPGSQADFQFATGFMGIADSMEFDVLSQSIDGDRATVEVLITGPFGTREKSDVELRKINGRWKIVN
jgi:hypothetical protein